MATRLQLRKSYQLRVAADVRDFNSLGESLARGESVDKSGAWVYFFSQYERREADEFGRKYAALADLNGHKGEGRELEGGCGFLLAATFSKAGNLPDNTPAVRSYIALSKAFDAIQKAGETGEIIKAKAACDRAKPLLEKYLEDCEMPASLANLR